MEGLPGVGVEPEAEALPGLVGLALDVLEANRWIPDGQLVQDDRLLLPMADGESGAVVRMAEVETREVPVALAAKGGTRETHAVGEGVGGEESSLGVNPTVFEELLVDACR